MNTPNSNTLPPVSVLRTQLGRINASINALEDLHIASVAPACEQLRDAQMKALVAIAQIEKTHDDSRSTVSFVATSTSKFGEPPPEDSMESMSDGSSSSFDSDSPFCWLRIEFFRNYSCSHCNSRIADCCPSTRARDIEQQTSSISKCPFGSSASETKSSSTNIPFFFSLHGSEDDANKECKAECECELLGCARVSLLDGVQQGDSNKKFLLFWATPDATCVENRVGYRSWNEDQQRRARADVMYNHLTFHGIHASKKSATDYAAKVMHIDHEVSFHVDGGQMYTLVI